MQLPRCVGLLVAALMVLSLTGCSKESNPTDVDETPEPESDTLDLPGGGEIEFLPGTFPGGATVSAKTASAPPLPPGVDPAGEAVRVEVTGGVFERPAIVRLPVPTLRKDEGTLIVFQVEDDGTQLMIGGEIDGGRIVAHTPGFGQSSLLDDLRARMKAIGSSGGRLVTGVVIGEVDELHLPDLSPPTPASIIGPGFLSVGGVATYLLNTTRYDEETSWTHIPGNLAVAVENPFPGASAGFYSIKGEQPGLVDIMVDYVGAQSGIRGFSSRTISIQSEIESGEDALYLGLHPPEPSAGGDFRFLAKTLGSAVMAWTWDFGDGTTGNQVSDSATNWELKVMHVYQSGGSYTVSVSATFASGVTLTSTGVVRVTDEDMRVRVSGPDRFEPTLSWQTKEYTAYVTGGEPGYDGTWRLYPGYQGGETQGSILDPMKYAFSFVEPGTYYLSVDATDHLGATAHVTRLITVKKVTDLDARIEVVPSGKRAHANDYTATISITGGILVVNGEKKDYDVEMHWNDGNPESATAESPSGPPESSMQFSHTFDEGEYHLYAVVTDGVGNRVDTDVVTIDTEPALSFTDCRVNLRVIGDIESTINGETTTTTSARRYLSNWAKGGFAGNTFTGTYEEEIFGKTGSIKITMDGTGERVVSYSWTEESETTGGVIVTTIAGTDVFLPGDPDAGLYKLEGEATCGKVTTVENFATGAAPFTLTDHRCNSQSSIEISFMER